MKVLLIYPLDRDFMPPAMPPLGLAYVARALLEEGHEVRVIDLNENRQNGSAELKETLSHERFGFIGISSIITQYKKVKELGKLIKSLAGHTPLVMGGTGPTSIPQMYLDNCSADIVCIGEGEAVAKGLASALQEGRPLQECRGIVFKGTHAEHVSTPKMDFIAEIDTIGFPAWEHFPGFPTYINNHLFRNGRQKGMSILSTRGCPGRCNYCMCNFGRRIRVRSVENIFQEITSLVEEYAVEHIHFVDDTLITATRRMQEICVAFQKLPGITWSANVRADLVNPQMLYQMAASGCISLAYGIESASPLVLKFIKKGVSSEQARNAIRWTRDAGISLRAYFMIGMPCETPQTLRQTVEFCKENLVGGEFFFATPFPGTELYNYAREKNLIRNENRYLELVGEVRDFLINLTGMSNEQLFDLKESAEEEIREYLKKFKIDVPSSIRKDPRQSAASLPAF